MTARLDANLVIGDGTVTPVVGEVRRTGRNEISVSFRQPDWTDEENVVAYLSNADAAALSGAIGALLP